ncbi:NUDIX domain-containing protein, partial [Nocardia thailandica]
GHVELGEPAEHALAREIHEELGAEAKVGDFAGAVEHIYTDGTEQHHELNLVFTAEVSGDSVSSQEPHLEFLWVPASDLAECDLRPKPVRDLIESVTTAPDGVARPAWRSSLRLRTSGHHNPP